MCVFAYIFVEYVYMCVLTLNFYFFSSVYKCVHTCTHVCMCVFAFVKCVHMCVCLYFVDVCTCVCLLIFLFMSVHVCV